MANLATVWGIAGLLGVVVTVLLLFFADIGPSGAIFLAAIIAGVVGLILARTMTEPLSPPNTAAAAPKAAPAPSPAPAPAASAPVAAADGRPAGLSAPRGGAADDLKLIKGVGPKLEALLHDMGYFHFEQIAAWTEAEVAWVDENLEGFKGRVSRDEWVAQARDLMQK
ncbi:NADH:ubiquinone oxidoreductase [Halovulum dunhuangense]|uniref:NADH:ubiquinone oxidoreductase n=1 Tax=Halovulum dunhuangense TaxID=1505036 RepID=A0A849L6R5_9RHOB|nr:NADH:ubiquinone oxidoreductase [Halovulum dunhuangense]